VIHDKIHGNHDTIKPQKEMLCSERMILLVTGHTERFKNTFDIHRGVHRNIFL